MSTRPTFDWGLALARGLSASWKAGLPMGTLSGAISQATNPKQALSSCLVAFAIGPGSAFVGAIVSCFDAYISKRSIWDEAQGS